MPESGTALRDMLRMIRVNRFTATELAVKLGLSREQFDDRLALMERQGFLQLEKTCCAGQGGCARGCCSSRDRQEIAVAGYILSEKGRRIAESAS